MFTAAGVLLTVMRAQFQYVVAHEPKRTAKAAGPALVAVLALAACVPLMSFVVWPRLPNWLALETLGSTHYIGDTAESGALPDWHAAHVGRAWLESPLRFPKVALSEGQTLKIAYDADAGRDGFKLSIYRSLGPFQGVADFKDVIVAPNTARTDVVTFVAPREGMYVIATQPAPAEPRNWPGAWFSSFDVSYDVTWAIERTPHMEADAVVTTVLPQLRR